MPLSAKEEERTDRGELTDVRGDDEHTVVQLLGACVVPRRRAVVVHRCVVSWMNTSQSHVTVIRYSYTWRHSQQK